MISLHLDNKTIPLLERLLFTPLQELLKSLVFVLAAEAEEVVEHRVA
jgi:hypothetical protein